MKIVRLALVSLLLTGCAGNKAREESPYSKTEQKVIQASRLAAQGKQNGPLDLKYRKLTIEEIAEHLDMDEETALLHLKATNVHGYYSLIAKNYPPGEEFILYHISLAGKPTPGKKFKVNERGVLTTPLDETVIDLSNNFLFFANYLQGEPADFVLASTDGKYTAATRIIPNPIHKEDSLGRELSVEITSPDKRQFIVHGKGLEPFGEYMLIVRFENEKFVHAHEADADGEIFQTTGPNVPWVTGGDGSVELRGDKLSKPLQLEFKWGA